MILAILFCLQLASYVESCNIPSTAQCETGWTYYKRNTTGWCMKIVVQDNLNKTDAENICTNLGAVISSIDDSAMSDVIVNLQSAQNANYTWLGAELKSECQCGESSCPITSDCDVNGYYWTDGFTTSNDYIVNNLYVQEIFTNGQYQYVPDDGVILMFSLGMTTEDSNSTYPDSVLCGKPSVN